MLITYSNHTNYSRKLPQFYDAWYIYVRQVHLLMPMDRATLPHAKSMLCCTPSIITRQQAQRSTSKAHCYTDCHLSVISTYIHGNAQTPLG